MKTGLTLLVLSLLVVSVIPGVLAVNTGGSVTPDIGTEDFAPRVWMCDSRIVLDDNTEPGRNGYRCRDAQEEGDGDWLPDCELLERINNYAFEGEQISWKVLVFDKNGIEKVEDVFVSLGESQADGEVPNDIEANCHLDSIVRTEEQLDPSCNARILEEELDNVSENTAAYYTCTFTVEDSPDSPAGGGMYGEFFVTVEATDLDGLVGTMDENEYWFFNPVIALSIDGALTFDNVRPGTSSYSDTLLIGNDADLGSGVMLDMFISGTDFYDSSSSGAKCPVSNQLSLSAFRYFATNGAYSTLDDMRVDNSGVRRIRDSEGYVNIDYGIGFNDPTPFYHDKEIIQAQDVGPYYVANVLAPGAEMALTFKLNLPEPCNGDFDTGSIYFWGEAI